MSPSTVRRYRAERLLRREFKRLRDEVLKSVRGRLRARCVYLDDGDLEACYAHAWQGLYAAVVAGEEVANPGGWLAVVTFRRAIDEHRGAGARGLDGAVRLDADTVHATAGSAGNGVQAARAERDFAAELDDRARLRQLFEALRSRLSERECEAASLCYLQGFTRAQAARRMGISEARMTKLMEGRGAGRPGVAAKVGELLETVGGGRWCEQQSSLMRGFAFGILDPTGERYRLARLHQRECPACRAYVLSLRGLAAVLPPLPPLWLVPLHPAPAHSASTTAGAGAGGGGAAAASAGAAGAGGAGGGWLLGGSVGTKLAVSCLLALGVGCVAITATPRRARHNANRHQHRLAPAQSADLAGAPSALASGLLPGASSLDSASLVAKRVSARKTPRVSPIAREAAVRRAEDRHARREFGIEQPATSAAGQAAAVQSTAATTTTVARTASVDGRGSPVGDPEPAPSGNATSTSGPPSHAEREFGPE